MKRAQSARHYARPSHVLITDDLGVLKEADESTEEVLRRQLLDKEREIDRLKLIIQSLQDQLSQRPPMEQVQELQQEFRNLELILQGTQRENEKCMADLERQKLREKMLERELTRLAGDNWQACLEIAPQPTSALPHRSGINLHNHHRSNTITSISRVAPSTSPISFRSPNSHSPPPPPGHRSQRQAHPGPPSDQNRLPPEGQSKTDDDDGDEHRRVQLAHLEQLRMLILGMEQRLEVREDKLVKTVERAEDEGRKYEAAAAAAIATTA